MEKINDAYVLRHEVTQDFNQHYFMCSDLHFDSKYCDRVQLKKDFDKAKELNANIMIFGDAFDAMGGKFDKRTDKKDLRPEYNKGAYFDDIVDDFADWLKPYADNIIFISDGNHELSIFKIHEFSIIDRLTRMVNKNILHGKYAGFIRYMFERSGGGRSSKVKYYTHGTGGNAPVTKNTIRSNRRQDAIQADFYVSGHVHTEYSVPRTQTRLNLANKVEITKCHHWQLGTYKNDHLEGGWSDTKEFSAPNIGGRFLHWFYDPTMENSRVDFTCVESKR